MDFGLTLLVQVATTAVVVLLTLAGFWFGLVRPFLNAKVEEIVEAAREIEPGVKRGVRESMEETLRDLPEATVKESARQFRRFGSGLFENGLSSLLGDVPDSGRRKNRDS